jgi:hypothetical protein
MSPKVTDKFVNVGDPWPLEVVDFEGRNIRYPHPPRTIFMYESAKLIHGT